MRVTWLFAVVSILVLAGVFLASLGFLGELPPAEPDLRPDVVGGQVEFDVVVRGYRMDEVDDELARLHEQIERLSADRPNAASDVVVEPDVSI